MASEFETMRAGIEKKIAVATKSFFMGPFLVDPLRHEPRTCLPVESDDRRSRRAP